MYVTFWYSPTNLKRERERERYMAEDQIFPEIRNIESFRR